MEETKRDTLEKHGPHPTESDGCDAVGRSTGHNYDRSFKIALKKLSLSSMRNRQITSKCAWDYKNAGLIHWLDTLS
ncbi:hypothetical protein RB195_023337 [Necator americanus]|uniref:SCP domain-containing protein n=1 Tax=Necator americanus TaxID=51031 RepID=A0ABR1EIR5_NECAM